MIEIDEDIRLNLEANGADQGDDQRWYTEARFVWRSQARQRAEELRRRGYRARVLPRGRKGLGSP